MLNVFILAIVFVVLVDVIILRVRALGSSFRIKLCQIFVESYWNVPRLVINLYLE
jgi:hypothetical protein